ncbi:hypothetical protein PM082_005146 [Marasmius tenuissimus]|nr:hypothetical protein PM082_005146 [Marasmius tenuissimus]
MSTSKGTVLLAFFFLYHSDSALSPARPTLARQDISSDNLLSYYSSPLADNPLSPPIAIPISRQSSTDRDSNSDYSSCSYKSDTASDYSNQEESAGPASVTRRTSKSSKGAADRRRLAIVQVVDSKSQPMDSTESSSQSDLRTRRGGQGGLALVAPPDVSPAVYMSEDTPVPPFTAPPDALHHVHDSPHSFTARRKHETSPVTKYQHPQGHQRSASEITTGKRDIAIIGTLSSTSSSSHSRSSTSFIPPSFDSKTKVRSLTLESSAPNSNTETSERALHPPPLFVRPQSRSPSPGVSSVSDLPTTPDIGEGKAIDVPVASPIVIMTNVDLRLSTASTSASTSTRPTLKHATNSIGQHTSSFSTTTTIHSTTTPSTTNIPTTTATTASSSPVIIPPSAQQTPQKQKTTPSIVVVPNTPTPKSPTTTAFTPKSAKTMMSLTPSSSSFSPSDLASYRHYMPGEILVQSSSFAFVLFPFYFDFVCFFFCF